MYIIKTNQWIYKIGRVEKKYIFLIYDRQINIKNIKNHRLFTRALYQYAFIPCIPFYFLNCKLSFIEAICKSLKAINIVIIFRSAAISLYIFI